jgi:D-aspartate ligase
MDFEVLIIGSDVNAYYMARCTHEAYNKKAYMLIKDKLAFTTYSKIINHIYNDKIWNEKDFVDAVNGFASKHSDKKILVISSNETYAQFLVKNKNHFYDNVVFNYPSLNILESLINKEKFYKTYDNSVLSLPKTIYVDLSKYNNDKLNITFPVIVKPANVVLYNHVNFVGKEKIYKLNNESELSDTLSLIKSSNYDDTLIVQEYIPGDDSYLFDSVVYCDKKGKVKLLSFAQIGLQEHNPNMIGNAAVLINGYNSFGINSDKMVSCIRDFMESISFHGFAEFDLKYDYRDKKFKVLEINARQGRCSYYISKAGFNLVKTMVDDLILKKELKYQYIDKKVMLSFVTKSIIKKYISNQDFKKEALKMYKSSCNPLIYNKDKSVMRYLLYLKRNKNYANSYAKYKW